MPVVHPVVIAACTLLTGVSSAWCVLIGPLVTPVAGTLASAMGAMAVRRDTPSR